MPPSRGVSQAGGDLQRPGLLRVRAPYSGFVHRAARAIVEHHPGRWPDLSGLLVLVPDLHGAGDVARALAAAGGGSLLLPRITTLHVLASTAPLRLQIVPQSVREVEIYAALARRGPFSGSDVWALASELVALFDRMSLARSPVASDLHVFTATLREAYRAGRNRALEYEAALVHELWWAQLASARESGRARERGTAGKTPSWLATCFSRITPNSQRITPRSAMESSLNFPRTAPHWSRVTYPACRRRRLPTTKSTQRHCWPQRASTWTRRLQECG
jgi:hypothetical protein